jgi:hypothetical protein
LCNASQKIFSVTLNKKVLHPDIQSFIKNNLSADLIAISLKRSPFPEVSSRELATQIKGLGTAAGKLPTWFATPGIYYPPSLNLEQASSEPLARYKAGLIHGEVLVDLTGGFGVDAYFFSKRFKIIHYCERDANLAEIAAHNFNRLDAHNILVHVGDGLEILPEIAAGKAGIDCIYLDPSRRGKGGKRVFRLADYQPPVADLLPRLFSVSKQVLLKTSPMLDLTEGQKLLSNVKEVYIVGVQNEVRELLWRLEKEWADPPELTAMDLDHPSHALKFTVAEESATDVSFGMPMKYLYEPNACILKAGGFKTTALRYGLVKLHPSTHLYTSNSLISFPGRRFEIKENLPYKPGKLPYSKANVSTRNFPESVAEIRKRNRISDGGTTYLFFVRCIDESLRVLLTEPV